MEEKNFSKKDMECLDLLLKEFAQILNEYARKGKYNDESINKSKKKSKQIDDLFRKNGLLG